MRMYEVIEHKKIKLGFIARIKRMAAVYWDAYSSLFEWTKAGKARTEDERIIREALVRMFERKGKTWEALEKALTCEDTGSQMTFCPKELLEASGSAMVFLTLDRAKRIMAKGPVAAKVPKGPYWHGYVSAFFEDRYEMGQYLNKQKA